LEHRGEVAFWQSYFPTKPRVPFSDFVKALWRHTAKANKKPGSSEKTCGFESSLLKLLVEDSKLEVSLESFGRLIGWFGPLNERGYFEDFCNIMQMESTWFFPSIQSGLEAEGYISAAMNWQSPGQSKGTFLVRLTARSTERQPGERKNSPFTITFVDESGIAHVRIPRNNEGYSFTWKDKVYKHESLVGLISTLGASLPNIFNQHLVVSAPRYK